MNHAGKTYVVRTHNLATHAEGKTGRDVHLEIDDVITVVRDLPMSDCPACASHVSHENIVGCIEVIVNGRWHTTHLYAYRHFFECNVEEVEL